MIYDHFFSAELATRMGAGAGGTRNISGNDHPLVELERELAGLHGKEAALVFTSGYLSNETGIATIAKLLPNSVILSDVWNHNSMAATWPLATFAQSPERMRRIGSTSHCATAVMLLARIHKKMAPDHKTGSPRLF